MFLDKGKLKDFIINLKNSKKKFLKQKKKIVKEGMLEHDEDK